MKQEIKVIFIFILRELVSSGIVSRGTIPRGLKRKHAQILAQPPETVVHSSSFSKIQVIAITESSKQVLLHVL